MQVFSSVCTCHHIIATWTQHWDKYEDCANVYFASNYHYYHQSKFMQKCFNQPTLLSCSVTWAMLPLCFSPAIPRVFPPLPSCHASAGAPSFAELHFLQTAAGAKQTVCKIMSCYWASHKSLKRYFTDNSTFLAIKGKIYGSNTSEYSHTHISVKQAHIHAQVHTLLPLPSPYNGITAQVIWIILI